MARMRWNFPKTNGGMDYVQDPSSSHFNEAPISNLVREVIQNSLDARYDGLAEPVRVAFTEIYIKKSFVGGSELEKHVRACRDRAEAEKRSAIAESYQNALDVLGEPEIRCLKIEDTGTTGLRDGLWDSLVTQEGSVNKFGSISGGAYGIGKNAALNVSDLNTVFYSTRYIGKDDGPKRRIRGRIDKIQGKATLMTHFDPDAPDEKLQHIGFYTDEDGEPLIGARSIPKVFRLSDTGTGVFIMGFNPRSEDWMAEIARAAVDNYFYAIHNKQLVVSVRADDGDPIDIIHDTLDDQFGNRNTPAYFYYRAIRDTQPRRTQQIEKLRDLDAYVLFDKDAPRRTGYINRNGMLITDSREQANNPLAPRGKGLWPDYAVIVMPAADEGDMWVREMENPNHTTISPEQLSDKDEIRAAKNCFLMARRALTEIIDRESGVAAPSDTSNIGELTRFFPEEDSGLERDGILKVRSIQRPRPTARLDYLGETEDEDDAGDKVEGVGRGRGSSDGSSGNDKSGVEEEGNTGKQRRSAMHVLSNVRVIPRSSAECYIAFTPDREDDVAISLPLIPAGADAHPGKDPNRRRKVEVIDAEAVNDTDAEIYIENGEIRVKPQSASRVVIKVETNGPMDGYAFTLTR